MPRVSDATAITLDLKWMLVIASILLSAGGMMWQLRDLTAEIAALQAQQKTTERALIEVTTTLRLQGTLK